MSPRQVQHTVVLWLSLGILVALALAGALLLDPVPTPLQGLIRVAALLGFLCVFVAAVTARYKRELLHYFGRSFIQVHHLVSVTGLAALFVHAIAVAWAWQRPLVLLPGRSTAQALALWLFAAAALVAVYRRRLRKSWRELHWLTYPAFLIGTWHALTLGTNLQHTATRVLVILMTVVVIGLFILNRRKT